MWGTDQCAYIWGDQILTHAENNASEDNVPRNHITADMSNEPNDVDSDHTHPDEGDIPKTPKWGDVQKSLNEETDVEQQNAGNTALNILQMSQQMLRRMS
jgi:hypothetical protein